MSAPPARWHHRSMENRRPPEPAPPVMAAIAAEAAGGTAAERVARFHRILRFDESLLLELARFQGPWRTRLAHALTAAGDARSWTFVTIAFLATCNPTAMRLGARIGTSALLATLFSQVLKRTLGRARPTSAIEGFTALAENPDAFSFPSGHTSAAFAVAVALAGAPFGIGPVSLLLATGIGLSRVYLGAHYPLDVTAGAVLGASAGLVTRVLLP